MPKVSVIIPCYNLGIFLGEAIASVRAQTFDDYEIIVIDDGSVDTQTRTILDELESNGLRIIRTPNGGVAAARNCGIAAARGEYILPLDADDRIAPAYLEQAAGLLDCRPEVGIVYCQAELFGELSGPWTLPEFSLPHMLLDNAIFSAAFFRRVDWQTVGGYDERMLSGWEDWDFWLRLLGLGRQPCRLNEVLFNYRIRRNSRERSLSLWQKICLMLNLIVNNFRIYAANCLAVMRILLTGGRRAPGEIKV